MAEIKDLEKIILSVGGWTCHAKGEQLYNLIVESKAKVSVEIGTFCGRAMAYMATAHKEIGGQYIGIDAYATEPCLEGQGNADNDKYWTEMDWEGIEQERDWVIEQCGIDNFARIIKKHSKDALKFIEFPIDVLYIDGNGMEIPVNRDVELYAPLVRKGGYLALNDSNWGTKKKAKRMILEAGFIEYKVNTDCGGSEWIIYKKVDDAPVKKAKVDVSKPEDVIRKVHSELEGWSSLKQCMTLYGLVLASKASVSVDLGCFGGRMLFSMAYAHKLLGQGKCFAIDPWSADACVEGENDVENDEYWKSLDLNALYEDVAQLMIDHKLTNYSNIIRFRSQEAWPLFSQIDVLSVDGNHSEEVSCHDVQTYAPLVKAGGYLMLDDVKWLSTQKAQELILNYGFTEIHMEDEGEGRGWKVYRKLGGEGPNISITDKIIEESKKEETMDDKSEVKETLVHVAGKDFPIYDPSKKEACHPIPETPFDIALRGGMQIGPLKLQPMLLYLPDTKYWSDRWKVAQEHFKERGIENLIEVPGIHGKQFGIDGVHTYDHDNPGKNFHIGQGYVAQFLSVYMMYNIANVLPFEHFLFLECDADLIPDFLFHLGNELHNVPKDFDFLWVGSCCSQGKLSKPIAGNVYQFDETTSYPFCGHAYIISKKALPYVIQTQRDTYASSDLSLCFHTFPSLKCYGIIPRLADQRNTNLAL